MLLLASIIFLLLLVAFGIWTIWPSKKSRADAEARRREGTAFSPTDGFILGGGTTTETFSGTSESEDTGGARESLTETGGSAADYVGNDSGWSDFGGGGSGGDFGGDGGGGDGGGGE